MQTLKIQNELSGTSTHFTKIAACFSTTLKEIIFDEVFILGPSCLNDFLNTLKIITTRLKKLEVLSINPMNYRAIHDCPILINCVPFGDRFAQHFQIGNMTELRVLKFPKQIGSFCLTIPSAELKKLTKLEILDLSGWRLDSFEFLRFMPNLRVFKYAASPGCGIGT